MLLGPCEGWGGLELSPAVTLGWAAQPFCGRGCLARMAKRCLSSYLILPPGCRRGWREGKAPPLPRTANLSLSGAAVSPAKGRDAWQEYSGAWARWLPQAQVQEVLLLLSHWRFPVPLASACIWLGEPGGFLAFLLVPCACVSISWHLLRGRKGCGDSWMPPPHPQEPCHGCCSAGGALISPSGPG